MSDEQAQIDIFISEDLEVSERTELVAKLEEESGILKAWFAGGNHHVLTVLYEPGNFSHLTLLDCLEEHHFHGVIKH